MEVVTLESAPFAVNVHVVREAGRALVVDASSGMDWAAFAPRVQAALAGRAVSSVYLTHLHVDHVGGAARMARMTGAPLLMHEDEAFAVEEGDALMTGASLFGGTMEARPVTRLREGATVEMGRRRFEVLLVPGHSPAHTALWEPESRRLFCGDVAFARGSFGRVDLPGGDGAELVRSLERLAALDAVDLYPGHMEPVLGNAREALLESLDNARLMLL
jgi:glyoxylase-like metal-dependent hydrolase (beta-lactamase superfamily II)